MINVAQTGPLLRRVWFSCKVRTRSFTQPVPAMEESGLDIITSTFFFFFQERSEM